MDMDNNVEMVYIVRSHANGIGLSERRKYIRMKIGNNGSAYLEQ